MSFIRNIFEAVSNNLISGDAYYLIVKSVFVTIAIAMVAWIVAFVLGGLVSYFMCYEKKVISRIAKGVCFLLRSTPALLMMLLFYYVFFKSSHVSSFLIAGISIGFYGAGHFAEIIARAVLQAQKTQDVEVTRRLKHVFYSVALPQAMEDTVFMLKRLAIHMFQWTTVVGYISVNDLTEIMTRIGHRTMYPFFSIFVCIIFHLFIAIVLEIIFNSIEKMLKRKAEE